MKERSPCETSLFICHTFTVSHPMKSVPSHFFFPPGATQPILGVYFTAPYRALASSRTRLLDHTQRRATVGRTPLDE